MAAVSLLWLPAHAGTTEAYAFSPSASAPVTAVQNRVTYATPATASVPKNDTQVGFVVGDYFGNGRLLTHASGNTINRLTVTIEATVADPTESLTFRQPELYLPAACVWNNTPASTKTITCFYDRTRPGDFVPAFLLFLDAPEKKTAPVSPIGDVDGTDRVSVKVRLNYAEGGNGANSVPVNSVKETAPVEVTLGTDNPIDIRTAVSRGGTKLYTGFLGEPDLGDGKEHTELVDVPTLAGLLAVARINITKVKAEATAAGNACLGAGNFTSCPTFETTVVDFGGSAITLTPFLKTTYRVDASTLRRSPAQILNAADIRYTGGTWNNQPVLACTNGQPNSNGLPCVLSKLCYKNNTPGVTAKLLGDCEWVLINNQNGFTRIQ